MHYTCIVFGEDVEEQLEPYNENTSVERYKAYWDSRELEQWENILRETTRHEGSGDDRKEVELPPEAVLPEGDYTLEEMVSAYHARYGSALLHVDDGGIYEWSTYNPHSKWDWWEMGGRWRGYFKLKAHAREMAVVGRAGVHDNEPRHDTDEARKGDIDIEWMRAEEGRKAGELWDQVHEVIKGMPEALRWDPHYVGLLTLADAGEGEYTAEQAREEYWSQPAQKAIKDWNETFDRDERPLGWFEIPDAADFQMPREEYVQLARESALAPYAYVINGEWHAPGKMGWFSSTETRADLIRFRREFNELLDSLPDDTLMTLVDLHT